MAGGDIGENSDELGGWNPELAGVDASDEGAVVDEICDCDIMVGGVDMVRE